MGSQFVYESGTDTFTCPHGHTLTFCGEKHRRESPPVRVYRTEADTCRACPAFGVCTTNRRQGRVLEVRREHVALRQHRAWMATEQAQDLSARRKSLVEPVFGILKERLGLRRFQLRGLSAVRAEWNLLAAGFNLRTLARAWAAGLLPDPFNGPPGPADRNAGRGHRIPLGNRLIDYLTHLVERNPLLAT
jgi:hypothetical protein